MGQFIYKLITIYKDFHNYFPEYVQWIFGVSLTIVISLIMLIVFSSIRKRNKPVLKDVDNNLNGSETIPPIYEMLRAYDLIKEWVEEYGVEWSSVKCHIRENGDNYVVRFEIPNINLTNDQISSFIGPKLTNKTFEKLFRANLYLKMIKDTLNVYRSINGGTIIDAVINPDKSAETRRKIIKRIEEISIKMRA